jgi:hypothetical protein
MLKLKWELRLPFFFYLFLSLLLFALSFIRNFRALELLEFSSIGCWNKLIKGLHAANDRTKMKLITSDRYGGLPYNIGIQMKSNVSFLLIKKYTQ